MKHESGGHTVRGRETAPHPEGAAALTPPADRPHNLQQRPPPPARPWPAQSDCVAPVQTLAFREAERHGGAGAPEHRAQDRACLALQPPWPGGATSP